MAELVGAYAASHAPLIAREWETMSRDARETISASFDEMGRRLSALKPDVLVILSPDHWVNFFLDNLPSFCVGVGLRGWGKDIWIFHIFYRDTVENPGQ